MTNSSKPVAGDKRKPDEADDPRPGKAQKADDKMQTTLDDVVTRQTEDEEPRQSDAGGQGEAEPTPKDNGNGRATSQQDSAVEEHGREGATASNILEKGVIYFFHRGRVGIDHPTKVSDIARTFILLRPIPKDAQLTEGPIGDAGNSRLIAIPKKKLPKTGRDRWIALVEKASASFEDLRNDFLPANDYNTKTAGVRHSPAAVPIGQGVYALTTTGRESHLAYMLSTPHNLGEVQTTIGLEEKGSWILSTRNPQYPAPNNTGLPEGPQYSQEILDEFRSLRWMGTVPKHLVPNAQFLLVGESSGIEKAMAPDDEDKEDENKKEPIEEIEELEHEDVQRMEHLGETESDAIFLDLEAYEKDHPQLQREF
ncbi:hypothetical protein DHEL01_v203140 [Diaporthe helianthi]|uniref:BTB domain transcription factor n=1 Tax=Diaporthe helianthi TaxID=158607 RepID=A0A2P5I7L5_DIAHE|nr:hypothetical protein DHEL01_v203140 [Diaporthe helianthi]